MGRPVAGMLLALTLALSGTACRQSSGQTSATTKPAEQSAELPAAVRDLQEDLHLLGLLNRLQLTPEQVNALLPAVEALQQERARREQQIQATEQELVAALTEQRALALRDQPPPGELETRVQTLQQQVESAVDGLPQALAPQAAAVRAVLTPPQLSILSGQYEAELQGQELLDWLRGLPDSSYTEEASANAEGLADPDKGMDQALLLNLFNTARAMSETDYRTSRAELAQRLAPLYGPPAEETDSLLAQTFSQPRMGQLLREKLAALGAEDSG